MEISAKEGKNELRKLTVAQQSGLRAEGEVSTGCVGEFRYKQVET